MHKCCTLKTLLKLAIIKWRFRHEPKLVNIYMSERVDYLPSTCCIRDVELDTSKSQHVESIKMYLRAYDVWFKVKEKSGKILLFNDQLAADKTAQAHFLEMNAAVETLVHNLSMWKAEKRFKEDWLSLVRKVARDYHHSVR